ncbi:hypothetical protein [Pediococcus ethanolidurans]|uniref:Uncharacterized protein n=1 Tax=Pediococcus ethanolidurans TaxID=319653 RepID=A0A0R2K3A2_9LACO|nr:hypothetical protein [Pediococcus ethanolidurans]KRN82342.1 hypothetical protein IV87_GL000276 [Pediococcus ethanolidurans]GEN94369.1 hypothetical protein PET01_04190 [Pediococcus ethanolidurans]SER59219.1 hypothetical protein SAMN04487973_11060 [Pediococcus ethanolidurans]
MLKATLVGVPGLIAVALVLITLFTQLPFWLIIVLWIVGFLVAMITVTVVELKIKLLAMQRQEEAQAKKDKSEK